MWFPSEANAGCNVILDFFFGESRRGDNAVAVRVFVIIIGGIGIGFGFGFGFGHFPVRTRQRQTKAQPMASNPRMGFSCPSSQKRLRIWTLLRNDAAATLALPFHGKQTALLSDHISSRAQAISIRKVQLRRRPIFQRRRDYIWGILYAQPANTMARWTWPWKQPASSASGERDSNSNWTGCKWRQSGFITITSPTTDHWPLGTESTVRFTVGPLRTGNKTLRRAVEWVQRCGM